MGTENKSIVSTTPDSLQPIGNPQSVWDNKKFEDALRNDGYEAEIERALRCPCCEEVTGQGLSDCMNCGGTGWFFIDRTKTILLVSGMNNNTKYQQWTAEKIGLASITALPQDKLGYMDKIVLTELEMWFSERRNLMANDAGTVYFTFTIYNPVEIFEVYLYEDRTKPLIFVSPDNYTMDKNKVVFNKDYIDGLNLDVLPSVSFRYTFNPTYHVLDINRDLIKQRTKVNCGGTQPQKVNYPIHCTARLAHLKLDAANFDGEGLIDNTNYQRIPPNYNR